MKTCPVSIRIKEKTLVTLKDMALNKKYRGKYQTLINEKLDEVANEYRLQKISRSPRKKTNVG